MMPGGAEERGGAKAGAKAHFEKEAGNLERRILRDTRSGGLVKSLALVPVRLVIDRKVVENIVLLRQVAKPLRFNILDHDNDSHSQIAWHA